MSNLLDFAAFGGPVYVGRDNGLEARKRFKIQKLDEAPGEVTVLIPDNTYAVNSSFFLGLFGMSLKHFGTKDSFISHYKFDGPSHVISTLMAVLDTVFKSRGALDLEE